MLTERKRTLKGGPQVYGGGPMVPGDCCGGETMQQKPMTKQYLDRETQQYSLVYISHDTGRQHRETVKHRSIAICNDALSYALLNLDVCTFGV